MVVQRGRGGQPVRVYGRKLAKNTRGSDQWLPDKSNVLFDGMGWAVKDRGQRIEMYGQQEIRVYRMGIRADSGLADFGLWGAVEWRGKLWDVVEPPAYRHGTRHVRHWTLTVRERPVNPPGWEGP